MFQKAAHDCRDVHGVKTLKLIEPGMPIRHGPEQPISSQSHDPNPLCAQKLGLHGLVTIARDPTPVPISNTAVKTLSADDTPAQAAGKYVVAKPCKPNFFANFLVNSLAGFLPSPHRQHRPCQRQHVHFGSTGLVKGVRAGIQRGAGGHDVVDQ